ncbi:hypothetical protein Mapa_014151 [Marchantia paleacea]|nr:hypothetical protein Mapa_014151 [Marchantia paleacea]
MGKETGPEEVASLDRLLTRLALTEDAQLEKVLSKLLPMAISRMASPHQPTKLKVMEMLNHINKRVKDQLSIKLPLKELLVLYRLPNADPTVRNFSFIYIGMAYEHASPEEQAEVVPDLLAGVSKVRVEHQDELLRMVAKGLEQYASVLKNKSQTTKYAFIEDSADCNLFVEFCLQTLLYQPVSITQEGTVAIPGAPPGLSAHQATRVAGKGLLRGEQLVLRKLGLLNFVAELELKVDLLYPLFLVASVDNNEKVSKRGDELLKRKTTGVNLEDSTLIRRLFTIYLGTVSNASIEANSKVSPAGPGLKARLMATFTRSIAAANEFPLTLQCVFDCISGPGSTTRLKQAGMEFSVWIFKHAVDRQLKVMAPLILTGVIKLLTGSHPSEADSASKQMRAFCYQAIGQLAQRAPHLFSGSTEMVVRLFEALKVEAVAIRSNIQEALSSLAGAFKDCTTEVAAELEALLLKHVQAVEDEARFCSILWASRWNKFDHAPSRYLCMLGAADTKLDIREMAQQGLVPPKNEKSGLPEAAYPSLKHMLDYIYQQQDRIRSPAPMGERLLLFSAKTFVAMIEFLKKCFEAECNEPQTGAKNEEASSDISAKEAFRLLLEHGMAHDGTVELHVMASNGLLELAAIDPESIANTYKNRLPWLKQFVGHIDSTTREATGRLLGICAAALSSSQAEDLLKELVSSFELDTKRRFEDLQGAVCATGYVLAQCMTGVPKVSRPLLESTTGALITKITLDSANDNLAGSAAEALGHAGLRGPLPIPAGDLHSSSPAVASESTIVETGGSPMDTGREQTLVPSTPAVVVEGEPLKQIEGETSEKEEVSLALAVKNLTGLLACKEVKVVQKAVISLGHLCYGNPKPELLDASLSALFTLSKSKAEDILFSVGEALSFIWGGVPISADKILKTNFVSLSASTNFLNEDAPVHGKDVEMEVAHDENDRDAARDRVVKKLF